jgi:hypothetical protein
MEALQMRNRFNEEAKRKLNSRKSIQKGGALTAVDAIHKIEVKRKKEGEEAVKKATKAIYDFKRKAQQAQHRAGVDARREERGRKKLLEEYYKSGDIPDPLLLVPIRDPERNPTQAEVEVLQAPPDLLQALEEAKALLADPLCQATLIAEVPGIPIDPEILRTNDPLYVNGRQFYTPWQLEEEQENATDQEEGGREEEGGKDEEVESVASIDSIAYNADFFDPTEDPIASQNNYISLI